MLVQNHVKGPFDPKYIGDYIVVSLRGNQVEVQPANGGPTEMKHIKHVKYVLPANRYIKQLPDYAILGRKMTLRMNPGSYSRSTLEISTYLPYHKYMDMQIFRIILYLLII